MSHTLSLSVASFTHFSRNGTLLPLLEATMPLRSLEFSYGFGVYETMRVVRNAPYFATQHVDRLLASASVIELHHSFSREKILDFCARLQKTIPAVAYNLKIMLIGAPTPDGATLIIIPSTPYFPKSQWYRDGVRTCTFAYERYLPRAKTLNMLGSYLGYRKARGLNCYDALLTRSDGRITEGTRTNFLALKGTTLISAPSSFILPGITLALTLHVAKTCGLQYEERFLTFEELCDCDGAVLTGTSGGVLPIRTVDDHSWSTIVEPLHLLVQSFDAFVTSSKGVFDIPLSG